MDNEALILDLLEWISAAPRSYDEVMGAWRTSCPRLTIWEDALDARFVQLQGREVGITDTGSQFLMKHRCAAPPHVASRS